MAWKSISGIERWAQVGGVIFCQWRNAFHAEVEQPLRLALLLGDESNNVFVQAGGNDVGFNVARKKAIFVIVVVGVRNFSELVVVVSHFLSSLI